MFIGTMSKPPPLAEVSRGGGKVKFFYSGGNTWDTCGPVAHQCCGRSGCQHSSAAGSVRPLPDKYTLATDKRMNN